MKILVCNAGSTSLKFKLFIMPEETVLAECRIERVGSDNDGIFTYIKTSNNERVFKENVSIPNYEMGIRMFLDELCGGSLGVIESSDEIDRIGFKTVLSKDHYGDHVIDDGVIKGMKDYYIVAPAHNGPYLEAIRTMREFFKTQLFAGTFETAFHQTIPLERKLYGAPYEWYEKYGIQKMGYHGASHSYIASKLNVYSKEYKAVSCHLGGSGSLCAIENGKSVDTSFGMSLQEGIIQSNRTGELDWAIPFFLEQEGMSRDEITLGLNKKGGLLGISGVSNDMRYIEEAIKKGNERAHLALDVYVNGIVHFIGGYAAEMGGLDYIAFTGGIGEKSAIVRKEVCQHFGFLGLEFDDVRNTNNEEVISRYESKIKVFVIPANEELMVARRTAAL